LKVPTDEVTLLNARSLFGPLQKLKLTYGNRSHTVCDLFTASGHLVLKTDTGDFKAPADGELWRPPVPISMKRMKQLAAIYAKSDAPVKFRRMGDVLAIDTTRMTIEPPP
jgi:hypothetical protein